MSKNYVNTTSHKYVAKTESQQREQLHSRTMQSATPFSSSASVSMEQSINNYSLFSKETENKRSFTSDKVEFSHYICPKKSKNWLKNTTLEYIYKISSPQRKKFQWEHLQKKQFHQNSYKTLSPEKSKAKMNEMQKSQPPLHIKNPQKQHPTASENQKRSQLRSPRELTVCASSRQTPINCSEANKRGLRYTMSQKTM